MERKEMLTEFRYLRYPIIADIVIFDDGCEFCILTQREGFRCLVGGTFPIIGPNRLSVDKQRKLRKLVIEQSEKGEDDAVNNSVDEEQDLLWEIASILGDDALSEMFVAGWPPNKAFYVFHDMGRGESAFFPSLFKAYKHLITYYAGIGEGTPWDTMSNDELQDWMELVKSWRAKSPKRLLPREYLGAYYCVVAGAGWANIRDE